MVDRALFVCDDGTSSIEELDPERLPGGDLLVRVEWSGLNYKDALAVTGRSPIVRGEFPFIPGIDLSGVVLESSSPDYASGDRVLQTGWGLGETRWGGYSTLQRLDSAEVVLVPASMSNRHAMVAGTAGLTAVLAVLALEEHGVDPSRGPVLVTGASGGVGSFALRLLALGGFEVWAATGSQEHHAYLKSMGAAGIVPRSELEAPPARPLSRARWAGVVDVVGGQTLSQVLTQVDRHGCVAVCGLAGGAGLETTVFPLILRGIVVAGIDSNTCPFPRRARAWARLAELTADRVFAEVTETISLDQIRKESERLLNNQVRGRRVVRCQ